MFTDSSTKTALVTGAGRGIGRALLDELQKHQFAIVAVVRSSEHIDEINALAPGSIKAVLCDVTKPESEQVLKDFLKDLLGESGKIDLLVNNAGFGASAYGVEGMRYDELDRVLAVSCYGPIRCVRACLPYLRKSQAASIMNISSRFGSVEWVATGTVPHDQATYPYRIGKAALNMFTSCLSMELKSENIRVLSIDPGKVKTRFGPNDADTEASEAARSIVDLALNNKSTGMFLHASGEKLPW
ncbi:MAG: SDR family NAD(P)-dependent oxidoreductase [Candidatus Obscuribacterales bacterium]|nr:SDR family NAD(P)-dependent oxidoreductase [Candidatus Obscuribacterales bacterium]